MATILVIDDNETIRIGLEHIISKLGHQVLSASSGAKGLELFKKTPVDFVMTDLKMDGIDGVEVLRRIHEQEPECPTMIITAFGTVETAVEAMKLGAFDFLQKPFTPEVVRLKVERALELRKARLACQRLEADNEFLKRETEGCYGDLVGQAEGMVALFRLIEKVAPTDSSVLIQGESGTGKELVARAIHKRSQRNECPFVKVNCGALNDMLLESELFGHEKGSFTGAVKRRLGRFELAHKGTLFLDEIGDISASMQVKLLRVLQEQEFERVGGETTLKVDVRVISASHKDLKREVESGRFREDLYYRLHVVPLHIPPLRERKQDIALLAHHFVQKQGPRINPKIQRIDDEALVRLMSYPWPGNVRELENIIEQGLVFAEGTQITINALPEHIRGKSDPSSHRTLDLPSEPKSLPEVLDDLERQLVIRAYRESNCIKTETARRLGIKTSALYYKLEKYGLINANDPA